MSAPPQAQTMQDRDKAISRAIGEELRRTREARGWSRLQLVERLPSGIGERSLLSYEHGTRHLTALRLIEVCNALGDDAPTLLARALQRARIHIENMPLKIDLSALLQDGSGTFKPLVQWAHNALNENPSGIVDVEPVVVWNLALVIGCTCQQLANYFARFLPDDTGVPGETDSAYGTRACGTSLNSTSGSRTR